MKIGGFQKMTMLDFPGKIACTVFTYGCNLRCPFCHNSPLVVDMAGAEQIDERELRAFFAKRQGLLDGIAVTGGEPTLRRDLEELLKLIKEYGYETKLDTNGTRPDVLKKLVDDGLVDYVAMDIKNSPEKYAYTCGLPQSYDLSKIEESIRFLMEGNVDFEFRTTVAKPFHTEEDFVKIGEWIKGSEKYFLQQFKDSGDIIGQEISSFNESEMGKILKVLLPFVPNAQLRGV